MAYISREKALVELQKFSFDTSNAYGCGYSDCLTAVEDVLNDLPTADVVEVVYCKDCSWSTERTKDNELFQYQCRNTVACGKPRRACDFCSYGERRGT